MPRSVNLHKHTRAFRVCVWLCLWTESLPHNYTHTHAHTQDYVHTSVFASCVECECPLSLPCRAVFAHCLYPHPVSAVGSMHVAIPCALHSQKPVFVNIYGKPVPDGQAFLKLVGYIS